MKTPLLLLSMLTLLLFHQHVNAQTQSQLPRNFAAGFAGVEPNTTSALFGIEYERILPSKGAVQFGASGVYIFRYNVESLALFGDSSPEFRSVGMLMANGTLFTSKTKKQSGFFLKAGLGAGLTHHQFYEAKTNKLHSVGDLGTGWYIPFDAGSGLQLGPSLLFASEGGIVRLKAAFGF